MTATRTARPSRPARHPAPHAHPRRTAHRGAVPAPPVRWGGRAGRGQRAGALNGVPTGLLIGGAWRAAESGRTLAVEDPATGRAIARVADASPADCRAALDAAAAAQAAWAAAAPDVRARVLRRAAEWLRSRVRRVATVLTLEMGKPLAESEAEAGFAADYLEWFADEARRIDGRVVTSPDGASQHLVVRTPVGPCLIVSPWNFPLAVPARGIAAALAAGCTVVARPSALTPLSCLLLARALEESGLPAGVLNVVTSSEDGATDALVGDPRLAKLTFTGSPAVGRHLACLAAERTLPVGLELGGCAPFVVFADADLDAAVDEAFAAKMRNGGAACTAANRFYVQRPVAAEFTRRLARRIAAVRCGPGLEPGTGLGPMISARHVARLAALVDDALARGARLVVAGGPVAGEGHLFAPVVLADVPPDARVMREEVFGPIVAIAAFDTEEQALSLANASEFGLAAYLHTSDLARAMRFAPALRAGMVGVNRGRVSCVAAPFGGVAGSGYGSSGGAEGVDEYLVTRYLTLPATRPA